MHIGIFGGAFNPPHIGHKQVADYLVDHSVVDEVWYVPVFTHPWADRYDKHDLAPYDHRVAMLELMCNESQQVAHYKAVSFTYDILTHFSMTYPQDTFSWVMGSEYLTKWDDFLAMHPKLTEFGVLVYPRAGYPLDGLRENMAGLPEAPEVTISSSQVRDIVKAAKPYASFVPPAVAAYVASHNLYQDSDSPGKIL